MNAPGRSSIVVIAALLCQACGSSEALSPVGDRILPTSLRLMAEATGSDAGKDINCHLDILMISAMQIHAEPAYDIIRNAHSMGSNRPLILAGGPKAIYERAWEQVEQDAQFMAGARADVPVLLNEVRRLRRRLRELHTAVSENVDFKPGVTPRDMMAIFQAMKQAGREAEYLR